MWTDQKDDQRAYSRVTREYERPHVLRLLGKRFESEHSFFACDDEQSEDWLKNLSFELKVGEHSLHVVPVEELSKRHRVVVHGEKPDLSAEEALKLGRQNTGLATGDWIVTSGSVSRDATITHFACLVGDQSLSALKFCNFKPYLGRTQKLK